MPLRTVLLKTVKTVRRKKNGPFVTGVCGTKGIFDPLPLRDLGKNGPGKNGPEKRFGYYRICSR